MAKTTNRTIRIDNDLYRRLKILSAIEDRSVNEMVVELVRREVEAKSVEGKQVGDLLASVE